MITLSSSKGSLVAVYFTNRSRRTHGTLFQLLHRNWKIVRSTLGDLTNRRARFPRPALCYFRLQISNLRSQISDPKSRENTTDLQCSPVRDAKQSAKFPKRPRRSSDRQPV